ncbi:MAG: ATP-grasp domain-containing protein [bacterium]|nr:ATP-grasp domain-containing protein [bacterium]
MSKTLLVVQPSDDYARRVLDTVPDAVFLADKQRATELNHHANVIASDLKDTEETHRLVTDWMQANKVTLSGITICEAMHETSALAQSLRLPFHAEELVQRTRDKFQSSIAWQRENVPTPKTQKVRDLDDLLDFSMQTDGPYILKPSDGSGSAWVLRVDHADGLAEAHGRIVAGIGQPTYLIQRLVSGREFSADIFVERGAIHILRLTEKYLIPAVGRAGMVGAYYPARATDAMRDALHTAFLRGVMALGIKRGVVMVDAIWMRGKPYLLEMALRPGGDCLPDLCKYATGYDPIRTACEVAMGKTPELPNISRPNPVAALHLITDQSGSIEDINFKNLTQHPVVLHVEPYHTKGDELRSWEGNYDDSILASCIVQCARPDDLPGLLEELTKCVDLRVKPIPKSRQKRVINAETVTL